MIGFRYQEIVKVAPIQALDVRTRISFIAYGRGRR